VIPPKYEPLDQNQQTDNAMAEFYLGCKRLRQRFQDKVVLPGALMPHMFAPMARKGYVPAEKYDLTECYRLTQESYARVKRVTVVPKKQLPQVEYLDLSLFERAREAPDFKQHPPGTPGFWEWTHLQRWGDLLTCAPPPKRLVSGALRYALAKGLDKAVKELNYILQDYYGEEAFVQ
jgi:hypothetical protein